MASTDEEEAYEVERILAEKIVDGATRYLVKWQGYPDEESTWEPRENFDNVETLALWKRQKVNGDVLEGEELRRIQSKMDAFQAQSVEEVVSEQTSEEESDPEFDELVQPPTKRLKMVYDPPPLSKRSPRSSKIPTTTRGKATKLSENGRSPVRQKVGRSRVAHASTERSKQKPKRDTAPPARPFSPSLSKPAVSKESPSVRNQEQASEPLLPPTNKNTAPPMKFHAPEIVQRKLRTTNVNGNANAGTSASTGPQRDASFMPFKNLRHMNHARKRQAEIFEQPTTTSALNPPGNQDGGLLQVPSQNIEAQPETNDSWLFFSDDESGEPRDPKVDERPTKIEPAQVTDQNKSELTPTAQKRPNPLESGSQVEPAKATVERTKTGENTNQEQAKSTTTPLKSQTKPQSLADRGKVSQESENIQNTRQQKEPELEVKNTAVSQNIEPLLATADAKNDTSGVETYNKNRTALSAFQEATKQNDDRVHTAVTDQVLGGKAASSTTRTQSARRNSLFTQPPPLIIPKTTQETAPTANEAKSNKSLPRAPTRVEEQRPEWRPQHAPSTAPLHPNREYVPRGEIVRVPGREWSKGDLVVELYVSSHPAGGVKIQGLSRSISSQIIRLKPRTARTLPIYFDDTISYADYQAHHAKKWNRIYAVGAVEHFPESQNTLSELGDYLEKYDLAAYWLDPDPSNNLMMLLYSCRSLGWTNLTDHETTSWGETRLNVAFRNKFKTDQPDTAQQERHIERRNTDRSINEDKDTEITDAPIDYRREPRSRHASVVSTVSLNVPDDVQKSPSEQLTREMADYALESTNRRVSNAVDNVTRPSVSRKNTPQSASRQDQEDVVMTMATSPKELTTHASPSADPRLRAGIDHRKESPDHRVASSATYQSRKDVVADQLNTSATNSPRQGDTDLGLDRRLGELSNTKSSRDRSNVRVLVLFKQENLKNAQEVQQWLAEQVPETSQVKIQPTDAALMRKQHEAWTCETWTQFKLDAKKHICVLICDVNCPVYRLEGLGKVIYDYENVLCWQVNFGATGNKPMETIRMFPSGWVVAIAQDCFLTDPSDVLYILMWLRKRVGDQFSASKLMLPPNISSAVQEQALLSSQPENRKLFLQLSALIQELISLSESQTDSLKDLGFSVVLPRWGDVYSETIAVSNQLPAVEQKIRDKVMSDEFFKYFGAWALSNLTAHRRFMGFAMKQKPQNNEHVRFFSCDQFVLLDKKTREKDKERQRSRSRDLSVGRDHDGDRDRVRSRSQSRTGDDKSRANSRSRA